MVFASASREARDHNALCLMVGEVSMRKQMGLRDSGDGS